MRGLIIGVVCMALLGCATTKTIAVPIITPPIAIEAPPALPCYNLKEGDKAPVVYNALIRSIQLQTLYINDYLLKIRKS